MIKYRPQAQKKSVSTSSQKEQLYHLALIVGSYKKHYLQEKGYEI